MKYSDRLIQALFKGIYTGKIKPRVLPASLYFAIADYLKAGVYEGYGTTLSSLKATKMPTGFSTADKLLLTELRTNIYLFSAAKTYQQVREMSNALIGEDGKIVSFKQFREKADQTYTLYNKVWLRTEYDTAIGQAQAAQKWTEIEKNADLFPLLEYSAVLDKRTSDICRPLDGIIAPVNDPIWKKVAPLNHFNCRCLLLQVSEGKQTSSKVKKSKVEETEKQMDDLFKMNPGQDKYIFSKKHPYFDVASKDKELAKKNFNLKIPKND
ncbi:MAG: minor capsid protein [Chitinophagaceae bacterium]|nr:minor capsid protein [Chitinophagaceae bacterium]